MKNKILLLFSILSLGSYAQNASIKGKVVSSQNIPLENVNITLSDNGKGTKTDQEGNFYIGALENKKYEISCSYLGFAKKEITINVNGATEIPTIVLQESTQELKEVVVDGAKDNKFKRESSTTVSRLPLKDLENPQVYNSITSEVLKEQVVTNLGDALKNATGITRLWESTGRGGDGAEYYSLRGFAVQPTMINGLPGLNNGGLDPANVESIEVIKGPSGTLFGSSLISYGGLINIVTKKPYETFGGEVSYINGSYGLDRITADVNTPLDKDKKTLLRVNSAYHNQGSFQNAGMSKSFYFAPSLTHKASDRLTFMLNMEVLNKESVNAPMLFLNRNMALQFKSIDVFEQHYKNSFTSNNLSIKTPTVASQAQMLYKLSDNWTMQTALSSSSAQTDGYYSYLWDLGDVNSFNRMIQRGNGGTNTTNIQQNFIGDFSLFGLRNRMVVGVDYFNRKVRNNSTGWVTLGTVTIQDGKDTGILSEAAAEEALKASAVSKTQTEEEIYSAYISDVINFTPKLSAMLSARIDKFEGNRKNNDDDQTAVSPKLGLVYQPIQDKLSVFGNYMNGFRNVAPRNVSEVDGSNTRLKTFNAEEANQWEIGTKTNLIQNKLSITASYYDIKVKNRVFTDPNNPNNAIQGGEVQSKGIEFSLIANPVKGLNMIAGYSYNDSAVIADNPNSGYLGLRPESAGPQNLVNFWSSYTFPAGVLKGFGLGVGGNHASEYKTLHRSNIGTFTLPAYTILNASLSYSVNRYTAVVKLDNALNEKYYSGWSTITPQRLRSVSAGLTYKF